MPLRSTVVLTTRRRAWNRSAIQTSTGLLLVSPGWNWLASEPCTGSGSHGQEVTVVRSWSASICRAFVCQSIELCVSA